MRQDSEPSVEEILESIKQVIARDNRAEAAEERQRREKVDRTEHVGADEPVVEEVLDLGAESELADFYKVATVAIFSLHAWPEEAIRRNQRTQRPRLGNHRHRAADWAGRHNYQEQPRGSADHRDADAYRPHRAACGRGRADSRQRSQAPGRVA